MKTILATLITFAAVAVMADIPRPGVPPKPRIEPGRPMQIDTEAAEVLVYGLPAAKLTALKKDTNTMNAQRQNMNPNVTQYVFVTKQCMDQGNLPVAPQCLGGKQVTVTRTQTLNKTSGKTVVSYQSTEVVRLRGQ